MRKHTAKLIVAIVILSFVFSVPAMASGSSEKSINHADALFNLGLFRGTNAGYDLDSTPTRIQGLIMLIRLLGEEDDALAYNETHEFSDVPAWADKYVGYAMSKGYTKGTSSSTFNPDAELDAKSYVTFILRALGYNDGNGDFSWNTALSDSAEFGLMTKESASALSFALFNRGDMVDSSYFALTMPLKGESRSLARKLAAKGVFTEKDGKANGVFDAHVAYTYIPYDSSTVDYMRKTVPLASGNVTADIVTVNLNNPRVRVKSALVNNTIGSTDSFSNIASRSGAKAVINSNFFEAYNSFKIPIGHVVCNGQFMYGVSGLSSFGITSDNKVVVGKPAFFYRVAVPGSETKNWPCYELNSIQQTNFNSVVYTPAYGSSLKIKCDGTIVVIEDNVITNVAPCYAENVLSIPSNGYLMWLGREYTSTTYYYAPEVGDRVKLTPYLFKADEEGFTFDNVVSVVSGALNTIRQIPMLFLA